MKKSPDSFSEMYDFLRRVSKIFILEFSSIDVCVSLDIQLQFRVLLE